MRGYSLQSHGRLVLVAWAVAAASGCFPDTTGETPDPATHYFYYPVALRITQPEGRYLVAANSNFDLLFNAGTVVPLDMSVLHDITEACRGQGEGFPCSEFVVPREDEVEDLRYGFADYLLEDHSVLIGSYAGGMESTDGLLLLPVRADGSLTFIDVDEVPPEETHARRVLRCSYGPEADEPGAPQACGAPRRVRSGVRLRDDATVGVPAEPFAIALRDEVQGEMTRRFAAVGHMLGGEVSLFEVIPGAADLPGSCEGLEDDPGCGGSRAVLQDVSDSFPEGTSGMAVDSAGRFLIASRFISSLSAFRIALPTEDSPYEDQVQPSVAPVRTISVDVIPGGDDQRTIALSPEEDRAYVVSRYSGGSQSLGAILVLDTTRDERGEYADRFIDVIEVGPGPSIVRVYENPALPAGYLVYVVSFNADRVFVIDPSTDEVVDIIATRRGPHDLVFDPVARVAYLANFLESTVSIIDVDPESTSYHRILTTLGRPRRPRTND